MQIKIENITHLHSYNTHTPLERLNDRHKKFLLDVYDHHVSNDKEKLVGTKENLKKTEKEFEALKKENAPLTS